MKKILLLQFRDDVSTQHEYKCFLQTLNLSEQELECKNAILGTFDDPANIISSYRAVIIGGSGQYYLSQPSPVIEQALDKTANLLAFLLEMDFPTLGICFGHQLLSRMIGHSVVQDSNKAETGMVNIKLNSNSNDITLFKNIPPIFEAIEGHKDSVVVTKNIENYMVLAGSDVCDVQAFRYKNNIYGVQFHPELTPAEVAYRYSLYPEYLKSSGKLVDQIKEELRETPFAKQVLLNFVALD